jgi:two-component system probable response regulator PhcQ
MNPIYDYKRFAVLYVDDEEMSLKYFTRAFSGTFRIFTATNAKDGFQILDDHQEEIGVIMTDQRMPGEQGVQFLERARRLRPRSSASWPRPTPISMRPSAAVNTGAIYKYVTKPWDVPGRSRPPLKRSLEFFHPSRPSATTCSGRSSRSSTGW